MASIGITEGTTGDIRIAGDVIDIGPIEQQDLWINAGYFVFRQEVFDFIEPEEDLIAKPFKRLIEKQQVYGHRFEDFWSPMDTFKERTFLEELRNRKSPSR